MKQREIKNKTAGEITKVGTIVHDVFDEGLRFIVMRGPFHWCGYVGIPEEHPLAGLSYDDISFISAHGGLTYANEASKNWPKGYFWYGWDYGHPGDASHYGGRVGKISPVRDEDKDWTVAEVIADSWGALYEFKKLMRVAEKIANKTTPNEKN